MTVVLTTHYMEEADRLCDRIAIVDRGQIVARRRGRAEGRHARDRTGHARGRIPAFDGPDAGAGGMSSSTWLLTRRTLIQLTRSRWCSASRSRRW